MRLWRQAGWLTVGEVLSIGKLAVGQERYYERQVAQGLDDYFTGRGESPGRWLGRGAAELGLRGTVEDGELSVLMAGGDPRTGRMLREQPVKVAALDLTFSAPKSVSVLHAVADERLSSELVACHEEAVEAALAYLEETAVLVSRRTASGLTVTPGAGFVTAAFRHRMSRALDPQLHTHCVSANLTRGRDGRWTALHHPTLFRAAQTAGYLYQAHLRALVSDRLGLQWCEVHKGAAELEGIDRRVLEAFSQRRHEMRRAAEAGGIGLASRAGSQAAAIATRSRKQYGVDTGTWREEVTARAAEHGLDLDERHRLERAALKALDGGAPRPCGSGGEAAERAQFDALAGRNGLTELQNTFDRRAVLRALAQEAQQGARIDALLEQADRFSRRRDVLRADQGEFTTAELVGVERRLIAAAQGRAGEGVGRVAEEMVRRAIEGCGRQLTMGQRQAVEATVASGHGVQVIEALAGTGKTFTAGALRHVYEHAGYQVVGVAPTGRAVRELAEEAGIPSRTLDALLAGLERGETLPPGGVVVLDEAGMAATRQTAALFEAAQTAGCKVVAIGDPGQLHSVQAGGWMRAVGRKIGTLRLSDVVRQRDPLERGALAALHEGKPQQWLSWAREHGRITTSAGSELLDLAVSEWQVAAQEHGLASVVLITRDNETRRSLNARARAVIRERGALGEERAYGRVDVAIGDRVICRRNDRLVDVDNGTRGTVTTLDETGVLIDTDGGASRWLPTAYVAEHVEHAYALTGHGMQGGTVEQAFVVAAPHELTKGWSYTALSRARGATRLFVITDAYERARDELAPGERQPEPTEKELHARLQRYMRTRDDEDLAVEQLPASPAVTGSTVVDRSHARDATGEERRPREPATIQALRAAGDGVAAIERQLAALRAPEARRLDAADRRWRELLAQREALLDRASQIRPAPRLPLAADPGAGERANVRSALHGIDAELAAVRGVRDRLTLEIGEADQLRARRATLERALAGAAAERDALREELVSRQVASAPLWLIGTLGEQPGEQHGRDLWHRAARGLARHRLEEDVTDQRSALGEPPTDPAKAERYEKACATLDRLRRQLGLDLSEREPYDPLRLPAAYVHLFGEERAAVIQRALPLEDERIRKLTEEELRSFADRGDDVLAQLDRRAAHQALRLEHELDHHRETAGKQSDRALQLEVAAEKLGWRDRSERNQLRHDAALHREHAARHTADAERTELALQRLREAGRHPEQWLAENAQHLASHIAAAAELARRQERELVRHIELAIIDPPPCVRELIGERPVSDERLAQEWDKLTQQIERHRLRCGLDDDPQVLLCTDPPHKPQRLRHAPEERQRLAEAIMRYREEGHLPELEVGRELPDQAGSDLVRER